MGNQHTAEYAKQVNDGTLSLQTALLYHFTSNMYPPLPLVYAGVMEEVIKQVNKGDLNLKTGLWPLPEDIYPVPVKAYQTEDGLFEIQVNDLIEATRTQGFITTDEDL
jgi:hypothetical protein